MSNGYESLLREVLGDDVRPGVRELVLGYLDRREQGFPSIVECLEAPTILLQNKVDVVFGIVRLAPEDIPVLLQHLFDRFFEVEEPLMRNYYGEAVSLGVFRAVAELGKKGKMAEGYLERFDDRVVRLITTRESWFEQGTRGLDTRARGLIQNAFRAAMSYSEHRRFAAPKLVQRVLEIEFQEPRPSIRPRLSPFGDMLLESLNYICYHGMKGARERAVAVVPPRVYLLDSAASDARKVAYHYTAKDAIAAARRSYPEWQSGGCQVSFPVEVGGTHGR